MQRYFAALADALASNNYAPAGPGDAGPDLFFLVGACCCSAMMAVPVVQLALGKRKDGALVHFAFGAAEWRLFRACWALMGFC